MPIWDYKCNKCGKKLDDHMAYSIKEVVTCECGEVMERLVNFQSTIVLDHMMAPYMAPPDHIVKDPRAFYE